jgi:hypothetical protein
MENQKLRISFLVVIIFTLIFSNSIAQNVGDLNRRAKESSGKSSAPKSKGSSGSSSFSSTTSNSSSSDASGCSDLEGLVYCAEGLVYLFVAMGKGIEALADEQTRLAKLNKKENRLFALETNLGGGFGFREYSKLQGQLRWHIGWFSLDYRQNLLYDNSGEFQSREFTTWFNFVNRPEFKLRAGIGSLYFNTTRENFFLYGLGMEILPNAPIRIELWANLTQARNDFGFTRPRQEIGLRLHYDVWRKGFLNGSVFGGISNQQYYSELNFQSIDFGVNYFLSFSKFPAHY